jgi:hypothetical protein
MQTPADQSHLPEPAAPNEILAIDPEAYNAVVRVLRPLSIQIIDSEFRVVSTASGILETSAEPSPAERELESESEAQSITSIRQSFSMRFEAEGQQLVAVLRITLLMRFATEIPASSEFWEKFCNRNLRLYSQPVLREFAASMAMRAGLQAIPLSSVAITPAFKRS